MRLLLEQDLNFACFGLLVKTLEINGILGDEIVGMAMRVFVAVAFAISAMAFVPAHAFKASFSWKDISACTGIGTSPAFRLSEVPKGTASLAFRMDDLDAPGFEHGGSTVHYDGHDEVPQGAITFIGPCPPPGKRHRYRWTVQALGVHGTVLAKTSTTQAFPP